MAHFNAGQVPQQDAVRVQCPLGCAGGAGGVNQNGGVICLGGVGGIGGRLGGAERTEILGPLLYLINADYAF